MTPALAPVWLLWLAEPTTPSATSTEGLKPPRVDSSIFSHVDSVGFIVVIGVVAILAWLFRSLSEANPDPLLLNLTFFAFAGQATWTAEHSNAESVFLLMLVLSVLGLLLVVLEVLIFRLQITRTREHYEALLHSRLPRNRDHSDLARAMVSVTGVDFYPRLYAGLLGALTSQPRADRRRLALTMLPASARATLTEDHLTLPEEVRKPLWVTYVLVCVLIWILFLVTVLIS